MKNFNKNLEENVKKREMLINIIQMKVMKMKIINHILITLLKLKNMDINKMMRRNNKHNIILIKTKQDKEKIKNLNKNKNNLSLNIY